VVAPVILTTGDFSPDGMTGVTPDQEPIINALDDPMRVS